jgi:hypothetical protein
MMPAEVMDIFDEYVRRHRRGERPDVSEYIERAGASGDELGRLVDRYHASTTPPDPEEESVAAMRAWLAGEPPLLELRRGRGLSRDEVVTDLMSDLSLDAGSAPKVRRYFHELEVGSLDPSGVARPVWDSLERVLGASARALAALRTQPVQAAPVFRAYQIEHDLASDDLDELVAGLPAAPEWDEVDRLFRGG